MFGATETNMVSPLLLSITLCCCRLPTHKSLLILAPPAHPAHASLQPKEFKGALYVPTTVGMFVANMSDGSLLWRDVRAREACVPLIMEDGQVVHTRWGLGFTALSNTPRPSFLVGHAPSWHSLCYAKHIMTRDRGAPPCLQGLLCACQAF